MLKFLPQLVVQDSQFVNNTGDEGAGAVFVEFSAVFDNVRFEGNEALGNSRGGALQASRVSGLEIAHSQFVHNSAARGSACHLDKIDSLLVVDTIFIENNARLSTGVLFVDEAIGNVRGLF